VGLIPPLGPEKSLLPRITPVKTGGDSFLSPALKPGLPSLPAVPAPGPAQPNPAPPPAWALTVLAQGLGLPPDDLSLALLGFARFFALPLEPGLLHRLRREAQLPAARPGGEAAALAAASAEAKGLRLTGEALAVYAAAIDPGYRDPPEEESGGQKRRENRDANEAPPAPEHIKKLAEETEAASPLLKLVNRLPGKNNGPWTVLPFSFVSGGVEFKVSLRVLLKDGGNGAYEAERAALDIRLASRRWLFVLDRSGEAGPRTDVCVTPLPVGKTAETLEKEIREALGPVGGTVTVKPSSGMPAFADSRDDTLRSINKEV
jgi:hypothetical protein